MEFNVELYDDVKKFYLYKDIIASLPNFKEYEREIKLISLLENKKVQFDIDDIRTNNKYFFGKYLKNMDIDSILEISTSNQDFKINSMSFIIEGDLVISLKCNVSILNKIDTISDETSLRILMINNRISKFYLSKDIQN